MSRAGRDKPRGSKKAAERAKKAPPKAKKTRAAKAEGADAEGPPLLEAGAHPGCVQVEDNGDGSFTLTAEGGESLAGAFKFAKPPESSDPRLVSADPPVQGDFTVHCHPNGVGKGTVTCVLESVKSDGPGPFVVTVETEAEDNEDGTYGVSFPGHCCSS